MRIPFTKLVASRPETDSTDPANASLSPDSAPSLPSPEIPLMNSPLSPAARNSALQLVGTIREILVGDQVRSLDGRFTQLRDALQHHFAALVGRLHGEVQSLRSRVNADIENLGAGVDKKAAELHRQNAKASEDIKIASRRINSIEEDVNASVAQLRSEDGRLARELDAALARIGALETRLSENSAQLERVRSNTETEIGQTATRLNAVETDFNRAAEDLRSQNAALKDSLQVALMRVGSLEENLVKHIDEMRRQDARMRDEIAAAPGARGEQAAESLRCAVNDKMRELCDYVSGQVKEISRQMARQKMDIDARIAGAPARTVFAPAAPAAPAKNVFFPASSAMIPFPNLAVRNNGSNGNHGHR